MKITEQTRKLAAGCSQHRFEVAAKAKSSQAEKEAEESLIPEGFEFLADKMKVEED